MTEPRLWRLTAAMTPQLAAALAEWLDDVALAIGVLQPPRQPLATVDAVFDHQPDTAVWTAQLAVLAALAGAPAPHLEIAPIPSQDWLTATARAFPPLRIGKLLVHGRHDTARVGHYARRLQIDAATAFGTGEHPSTHMCLLLLQDWLRAGGHGVALDMGCGSGILALAYARLARGRTLGVDCDAESVRMARLNARANGLAALTRFTIGRGYGSGMARRGRPYDLIFANIFARPLMQLAADLCRHLRPGGTAILAGLLTTQEAMVLSAHRAQRLQLVRRLRMGEWSALMLMRKRS